jgi:hypothetical protein
LYCLPRYCRLRPSIQRHYYSVGHYKRRDSRKHHCYAHENVHFQHWGYKRDCWNCDTNGRNDNTDACTHNEQYAGGPKN